MSLLLGRRSAWLDTLFGKMIEDLGDDSVLKDDADDPHGGTAARTFQRVDFLHPFNETSPRSSPSPPLNAGETIIHEVDDLRIEPAWACDDSAIPGDTSAGEGTMWRVGETFFDSTNSITISIDSQTPNGFEVSLITGSGLTIFTDGFESGDTSNWSSDAH